MKNSKIAKIISLVLVLCCSLTLSSSSAFAEGINDENDNYIEFPVVSSDWTRVSISTAEDLVNLSESLGLDTTSEKMYVTLENDISLEGVKFSPIPYFAGIFNGNSYTISGFTCKDENEPVGLFATIGAGALVENLYVSGSLQPTDSCNYIGGIAGRNNGIIYNCSFSGVVTGDDYVGGIAGLNGLTGMIVSSSSSGAVRGSSMVGGIAGINNGKIIDCVNLSLINTEASDSGVDITDLDLDYALDISKLTTQDTNSMPTDVGGIAGYSSGVILNCTNSREIGYAHTGYNVGGIAGRSSGYIKGCTNESNITGRKDIGGIVGQMEPYIKETISESQLKILSTQLEEMQNLMTKTQSDASATTSKISDRVSKITDSVSDAQDNAFDLSGELTADNIENITEDDVKDAVSKLTDDVENTYNDAKNKVETTDKETAKTELKDSLSDLNTQIDLLNKEAKGYSDTLDADLKAINAKYDEMQDTIDNLANTDLSVEDTSTVDPDLITLGAVRNCENTAYIEGDLNAGGIAGTMGEESSIDPEDEISLNIDLDTYKTYEYKALLDACINRGKVYTKRNYCGGIVGRAEVGYLRDCESYGFVTAEGNYAGGIAASAQITIKNCLSKTTVSAAKYAGGVLGIGVNEGTNAAGSVVADCRALVEIADATKFYGAIASTTDGEYDNNIFVSDTLLGLGSYSAGGKAYAVDYDTLVAGIENAEEFTTLTLTFMAEDTVLKTVKFQYGESFGEDVYPTIPSKKDCFAKWDVTDLTNLTTDIKVNAVYTPYVASLASENVRSTGRPIFYVEGNFSDTDVLTVSESDANAYEVEKENTNGLINLFFERVLEEQWLITIPDDGLESHVLRYLPSTISSKTPEIYIHGENGWEKADLNEMGSYYALDADGNEAELAVIAVTPLYGSFATTAVIVLVIIFAVVVILRHTAAKKKQKALLVEERKEVLKKLVTETAKGGETSVEENEDLINFLADVNAEAKSVKNKLKPGIVIARVIICVLLALAVSLTLLFTNKPEILRKAVTDFFVEELVEKDDSEFGADIKLAVNGNLTETTAHVTDVKEDSVKATVVSINGINLYCTDTKVYLENGKAFNVSDVVPNYSETIKALAGITETGEVSSRKVDGGTLHTIVLSGNDALEICESVLCDYAGEINKIDEITVDILTNGLNVKEVKISGNVTAKDNKRINLTAAFDMTDKAETTASIPKAVVTAMSEEGEGAVITKDMLKLLYALGEFENEDPAGANIKISAGGKVITLSDNLSWYRTKVNDEWIRSVSKNGVTLYYTDKGSCTAKGISLTEAQAETVDTAGFLDFVYDICMEDAFTCTEDGNVLTYKIDLDSDDMESLATMLAPELKDLDVTLQSGSINVTVNDNKLSEIHTRISGRAKLVLSTQSFTVTATMTPMEGLSDIDIPSEVVDTLTNK